MDDLLRRALGEGIELETVISAGLWNTFIDQTQIENAILNLAINARDAMEGYGKLTIEAGNAPLGRYLCGSMPIQTRSVGCRAGRPTDTGCGIPRDLVEKVFEPFFTTKGPGKGTGLGLSMVYGLIKQSGGHIELYSEVGEGTTIRVYLPRARQAEVIEESVEPGPIKGGTETVLVVEDDDDVRSTVVELLSELGYRVLRATDATGAMAIVDSGVPIDLRSLMCHAGAASESREMARRGRPASRAAVLLRQVPRKTRSSTKGGSIPALNC